MDSRKGLTEFQHSAYWKRWMFLQVIDNSSQEGDMKYKYLLFSLLAVFLPIAISGADWSVRLKVHNHGSIGTQNAGSARWGEKLNALDGYDQTDLAYAFPPMSNSYVVLYFVHTDWGPYNGNFVWDYRSTIPATKIWNTTIKAQNPLSVNYTLSWELTGDIPAYYQPSLVFGQQSINLRTQSSFNYTTSALTTNCVIRVDYDATIPYVLSPIPDLLFSDNQSRRENLDEHFGVNTGSLTYSYTDNAHLGQRIVNEGGSSYWEVHPVAGWIGSTSVEISAIGNGHTVSQTVNIERDDTNSPPLFIDELPHLELIQNQSLIWSWTNLVHDADWDSTWVEIDDTENFSAICDNAAQEALIIPMPGFKGQDSLLVSIHDAFNPPQTYTLQLSVLPSEPLTVQNIQLHPDGDQGIICSWDAVNLDISGAPLAGIVYDIYLYDEWPAAAPVQIIESISDNWVLIPDPADKAFIRIIAINE
jgi:hypothetical protein